MIAVDEFTDVSIDLSGVRRMMAGVSEEFLSWLLHLGRARIQALGVICICIITLERKLNS